MFKSSICLSLICLLLFGITGNAFAIKDNKQNPVSMTSNQWSVVISQAIKTDEQTMSKSNNQFNTYSLLLKNVGKTVSDVRVEVFKNVEQESQTKMELFSKEIDLANNNQGFIINNEFPLSTKSKELEVVISWEEEPITNKDGNKIKGRMLKQTFVFSPNK